MTTLLCLLVSALPTQPSFTAEPVATTPLSALSSPLEPSALAAYSPAAALQDGDFPQMEYTFIEANYIWADPDDFEDNLDGWELTGSLELPLNFFLQGTYIDQSSDADVTRWRIGAGWHFGLTARLDAYGILSFEHLDVDGEEEDFDDFDEDGIAGEAGLRMLLTRSFEINGRARWADVEESDFGAGLGARFYFTDALSVGARYDKLGDDDEAAAGLRWEF